MITKRFSVGRMVFKMEKMSTVVPFVFAYILSTILNECAAEAGYFLFQPPFGGGKPQDSVADKRSDSGSATSFKPSETLWIGSHINPILRYIFQQPQVHHAQSRKFDPFPTSNPTKEPYQFQKPTPAYNFNQLSQQNSIGSKLTFPSLNIFAPRPQPPRPQSQPYSLQTQPKIEPRISVKPGRGYVSSVPTSRGDTSTQSPIFVSTSASILVSPPGTIRTLSSPGTNISPIVDRLKKMTQWSMKKQKKIKKKEDKFNPSSSNPDSPLERKLRLKKRLNNVKAKPHKHNIEAIILSQDDEEDASTSASTEQKIIVKENRGKGRTGTTSMSRESLEDRAFPSNNLVIIHPTNAVYLNEPSFADEHQTILKKFKKYQIARKDKKMGLFQSQQDTINRPAPFSFRFGPEDAKISPYA